MSRLRWRASMPPGSCDDGKVDVVIALKHGGKSRLRMELVMCLPADLAEKLWLAANRAELKAVRRRDSHVTL